MDLPPLTQQPVRHVDGTPDAGYPLRILEAYRQECDCRWSTTGDMDEGTRTLCEMMNKHCAERAMILDAAIARLQQPEDE